MFHIGLAKTGTSTIQDTLAANVEALRARGIVYPMVNDRRRQVTHHVLPQSLKVRQDVDSPAWQALRSHREAARDGTVLVSAEGFAGCDPRLVRRGIDGEAARVLVYVRNYPSWAVSSYSQRAKWGVTDLSFDDYLATRAEGPADQIADRLLAWAAEFGPGHLRIRSLDPDSLVNGQVIDDLLAAVGTTREGLAVPTNLNETPDWRVIELLKERHARHAAETGQGAEDSLPVRRRAVEAGLTAGQRLGWAERGNYLTRGQRRRLADLYLSDRERLLAAVPDCRIAALADDQDRDRPFLPSPAAVSPADRRAFEAAFDEAMAGRRPEALKRALRGAT